MSEMMIHNSTECNAAVNSIRDALYVLSGKWKLPLIVGLREGPKRFNEIQRALVDITPKVLSKELRELELNDFVIRRVYDTVPVTVTYELTPYSATVDPIIAALREWGAQHRNRIVESRRTEQSEIEVKVID
ncbi:helix-turn-helix transcriptional regulator [Mucilaginibacter pallidiroseus]|uniref:Helix-turn-helix transcriptional regulator n=2 Tax=Mucilaginibacter pallidiroseus TaxID=2599295 RepID=A0A563UK15_9SPHI|nr:helix-turn-helix transcriptional regulator [Mucilaginibacter pallidiroseus]